MSDLPKTITLDLSKNPSAAAMLQAILVNHEEIRVAHEIAYREDQARVAEARASGRQSDSTCGPGVFVDAQTGTYVGLVPPPPEKLDLATLALAVFREGLSMSAQRVNLAPQDDPHYGHHHGRILPMPAIPRRPIG